MRVTHFAWLSCSLLSLALAALTACGPVVTIVQSSSTPPKPGNCALQFIDVDPTAPGSTWEIVGQVIIQGGHHDAASKEARARVAPQACRLGGAAVTPLKDPQPSPDAEPVLNYAVLKRRGPPA
jgi:hypothetical protein